MKSSIKIDFEGSSVEAGGFEPVIRIRLEDSEDVRDSLMKSFFQKLGGTSSWLLVNYDNYPGQENKTLTIRPVTPQMLKKTMFDIKELVEVKETSY